MWQPIESFVMSLDSTASVWFSIVLNLVLATAFYFFTVYLIDHKIEVE
jgi:ABC-2 type transport system ATP-binding protein